MLKLLNKEGVTIILTTHYLFEAQEMCDRIAIINKGNLVALDTTQKLLDRIQTKVTFKVKDLTTKMNLVANGIKFKIEFKKYNYSNVRKKFYKFDEITNILRSNNIEILDIYTEDGDLEDVFLQLTKS